MARISPAILSSLLSPGNALSSDPALLALSLGDALMMDVRLPWPLDLVISKSSLQAYGGVSAATVMCVCY